MAVNTTEVSNVFASMMADIKTVLNAEFDANRLTSDLYAKGLLSTIQQTMQLATSQVQQQPLIDAQVAKTNADEALALNQSTQLTNQKQLIDAQVAKTNADEAFALNQSTQLTNSVDFNNKIKALGSYSDMIGTMGAGTLLITTDMWTAYFNMVSDLNSAMGVNPANTTVTKA